jgi:hypothetical protein
MIDNLKKNISAAFEIFLYHPEKTEIIIQIYFLNRLSKIIEISIFFVINNLRKFFFYFKK